MRSRFILLAGIFLLAAPLFAATGKDVTYKSGDETVHGVLYTPEGKGPHPAIVVIHEWWGLNDWVKEQAQKLAGEGYVALAIDLYRGKATADPGEAHELARGLPDDRALRDLKAAVAYLKTLKGIDETRIASIGWCMGGGWSLALAENEPTLRAAVINYGHLSSDAATLKPVNAGVLGLFGGKDRGITPSDVAKFAEQMKALGKTVDVTIYPEAGHGFENSNNPNYRADDAADAWKRTAAFLARQLKH